MHMDVYLFGVGQTVPEGHSALEEMGLNDPDSSRGERGLLEKYSGKNSQPPHFLEEGGKCYLGLNSCRTMLAAAESYS